MYIHERTRDGLGAIIGADTRQLVRDCTKAPYRWICGLDLLFPFRGAMQLNKGTGFLISPRHVLTVAHNVTPAPGVWATSITVIPGVDGRKLLGNQRAPVGSIRVAPGPRSGWWVPPAYTHLDKSWDFALLTLPNEFPRFHAMTYGHWTDPRYAPRTTITALSAAALAGMAVSLSGYPADKCKDDPCDPAKPSMCVPPGPADYDPFRNQRGWASTQWEAQGMIHANPPPDEILYDGDACKGSSGSPVWRETKIHDVTVLELIAVHTGAFTRPPDPRTGIRETLNRGVLLDAERLAMLRQRLITDLVRPTF